MCRIRIHFATAAREKDAFLRGALRPTIGGGSRRRVAGGGRPRRGLTERWRSNYFIHDENPSVVPGLGGLFARVSPVPVAGAEAPSSSLPKTSKPLDYFIVTTAANCWRVYADTHTHFLTRTLRPLGGHCVGSLSVHDLADDLLAGLRLATNRAGLVIVTGGLGPPMTTSPDRPSPSSPASPCREHPDVLAMMERRFNQSRVGLRDNLRRQTQVPERGEYLPNPKAPRSGWCSRPADASWSRCRVRPASCSRWSRSH